MASLKEISDSLKNCSICPRNCNANRYSENLGYCGTDAGFSISSIINHKGEEPVISGKNGICNIFFTGCNLHCIYCQNHQISRSDSPKSEMSLNEILKRIEKMMVAGVHTLGFVSTAHVVPQIVSIISELHKNGLHPVTVYNSNGYEKPETIKNLEGLIDVYLPDFKYINNKTAKEFSDAEDYPAFAALSIREMYRQKGSYLQLNDQGEAESGLLIRHLVLPGHVEESKELLRFIAEEISTGVHISLMSQYYPTGDAKSHPIINRKLYKDEYDGVADEMLRLGFRNGWIQENNSADYYTPDFTKKMPFGKEDIGY